MNRLTVEGGFICTLDEQNTFYAPGRLSIVDGAIERVGRQNGQIQGDMLNATGCAVMPGLINGHTHLFLTALRGLSDDLELMPWLEGLQGPISRMNEQDFRYSTYLGCLEALHSGTTCLCECVRYGVLLAAEVASEVGVRILVGGMPGSEVCGRIIPTDLEGLARDTKSILTDGRRYRGIAHAFLGVHSPYACSPDFVQEAKRYADDLGVYFGLHLAETRVEIQMIQELYGKSPVAHLDSLGVLDDRTIADHCVWLSDQDMAILKARGTGVVHCPVSNAKLASGVAPISQYLRRGISVGLGTDSAVSNNSLNMLQEIKFGLLLQRACYPGEAFYLMALKALRLATIEGARVLGLDDKIGSLEAGKRADLLILRLPPEMEPSYDKIVSYVVYAAGPEDIEAVLVDGRLVLHRGNVTTVDEPILRQEAAQHFRRWSQMD